MDVVVDVDAAVDGVVDEVFSGSRRVFITVWPVGRRRVCDWIASWSWELEWGNGGSP